MRNSWNLSANNNLVQKWHYWQQFPVPLSQGNSGAANSVLPHTSWSPLNLCRKHPLSKPETGQATIGLSSEERVWNLVNSSLPTDSPPAQPDWWGGAGGQHREKGCACWPLCQETPERMQGQLLSNQLQTPDRHGMLRNRNSHANL